MEFGCEILILMYFLSDCILQGLEVCTGITLAGFYTFNTFSLKGSFSYSVVVSFDLF